MHFHAVCFSCFYIDTRSSSRPNSGPSHFLDFHMHHPNDSDEHIFSHRPQVEFTVEFRTGWRGGKSTDSNTHQKILEALFVCINNDRGCSVTTPNRFLHRQQVYFTAEFRTKSFSGFADAPAFNQTRNINPTNPNYSD